MYNQFKYYFLFLKPLKQQILTHQPYKVLKPNTQYKISSSSDHRAHKESNFVSTDHLPPS